MISPGVSKISTFTVQSCVTGLQLTYDRLFLDPKLNGPTLLKARQTKYNLITGDSSLGTQTSMENAAFNSFKANSLGSGANAFILLTVLLC